jgi:predicted amidohydrolase YtcJ
MAGCVPVLSGGGRFSGKTERTGIMNKRNYLRIFLFSWLFVLILACFPWESTLPLEADLIYYNGEVITMEPDQPQAEAVAILGEKIIAVGSDDTIMAHVGSETQVIDLGGRTLLPGFIDSHAHWIGDNQQTGYSSVDETVQYLLENGWTSINEMFVTPERLADLQALDQEGRLKVRVNAYMPVNYRDQYFGRIYQDYTPLQVVSPRVRLGGVKFVPESYYGETFYFTQSELNEEFSAAHDAGWQIAVHTEMARGHARVLEAFSVALSGGNNSESRHRIEHVFGITDDQLAEIKKKGYIASIQLNLPANFPYQDPTFYDRVPEEDFPLICRWRDLYDAGVLIAGGTDWPWLTNDTYIEQGGAPAGSPLRLIYKAATHTNTQDVLTDEWMDGQYLPVEASLEALTINGAYATFEEDVKGSLARGKWADMVILSENPVSVADADIRGVRGIEVLMTMIGGTVEYCAPGAAGLCPDTGVAAATAGSTVTPEPGQEKVIRLRMTTTSDWTDLFLVSGAVWEDAVLLTTSGRDIRVDISDNRISMGQPLAQAEAGESVEATYELRFRAAGDGGPLVFRIDRGNLGATTVELYRESGPEWVLIEDFTWDGISEGGNSADFEVPHDVIFED